MCQLFESIRIEGGVVHNVSYHQARVDRSIGAGRLCLASFISTLDLPRMGLFKLRVTYCERGVMLHSISPYFARQIKTLQLVVDDTIVYDRKSEDRSAIAHLLADRGDADDILIVRGGLVTDASFANVALHDGEQWVTPALPLLEGTCRARLVDSGILVTRTITVDSLSGYSNILLINAMIDFAPTSTHDILIKY